MAVNMKAQMKDKPHYSYLFQTYGLVTVVKLS